MAPWERPAPATLQAGGSRPLLDDSAVILVRLAVLALLYLFLAVVLRVVWRDVVRAAPRRRGSVGRAFLVVQSGGQKLRAGSRIAIEGAASIGRDSDNQIVIDDTTVSGRHAALIYRDGCWWLEDLGSTNGTWLGDRRVENPQPVGNGELIQVGRIALRFG